MNDAEAVRRCQAGELDAFRHLVEQYKDILYGAAYLMTGSAATAEEHVQEAFVSAWRGLGGFNNDRPVKPWLVRILVNRVLSERRRGHIVAASLDDPAREDPAGPDDVAHWVSNKEQVEQALRCLSNEHRQVVLLRFFTGLSLAEIAEVLRTRVGTVKSRLHRALQHMRTALEEQPPTGGS